MTKLEMSQKLAAQAAELDQLRHEVSQLRASAVAAPKSTKSTWTPPPPSAELLARRAAMAAAKQAAMTTGKPVTC